MGWLKLEVVLGGECALVVGATSVFRLVWGVRFGVPDRVGATLGCVVAFLRGRGLAFRKTFDEECFELKEAF
ncbi:MAG: hypothetical protein IPJ20_16180 [Flammeovirgaceae bacterium]|nr:hypothetical protein [Flammeovirgaceae bacterium]